MALTAAPSGLIGMASEGVVSFRNGQHLVRYPAFAVACSLPVEVHETEAELLERVFAGGVVSKPLNV